MPELMGLSLLLGLLALMATAAVARGWLRAEEEICSRSAGWWGWGGWERPTGTLLPASPWSYLLSGPVGMPGSPLGLSFSSCGMTFVSRQEVQRRPAGRTS